VESSFTLAEESPLPAWFADAGVSRAEATVTMDYYNGPLGRTAVFSLYDGRGRLVVQIVGEKRGTEPARVAGETSSSPPGYPLYEVIAFADATEVIEHRRMEPIFYINTDSEVRQKLNVR
jgi:hypothetical protein